MADEMDGLLNQADVDAALAAAGFPLDDASAAPQRPEPTAVDDAGEFSQADIDAALAEAGLSSGSTEDASAAPADTRVDATGRPFDEVAAAMAAAIEAEAATPAPAAASRPQSPPPPPPPNTQPFSIPEMASAGNWLAPDMQGIDLLKDVELNVKIELGRSRMLVDDVLRLGEGSIVELDKLAGDPVDVFVNDRLIARGEVLVLNDNFCVRVNEIVTEIEEQN